MRWSRTRFPATTVSTVTISAVYPAACARSISPYDKARSRVRYSWNHSSPSPPTAPRSSSTPVVAIVDSVYGSPCRAADRADPISPSGCIIRVYPVGASTIGAGKVEPNTGADVSARSTPASTRGRNRQQRKAAMFEATEISSSAAPST